MGLKPRFRCRRSSTNGEDSRMALIQTALSAAVPLWILELQKLTPAERDERARICGDVVAEKGDIIQFRSKRKGETAAAFNRLAEGIACLAFAPGGVTAFGLHFEAPSIEVRAWADRLQERLRKYEEGTK